MTTDDTIAAISSATGAALRTIVRVSGDDANRIVRAMGVDVSSESIVQSIQLGSFPEFPIQVWSFRSPNSFTGDDLIELHLPGSTLLARRVLEALIRHGTRQTEPGEFTSRAYLNHKFDLTAAEGVAATIESANRAQMDAARRLLSGELARRVATIVDDVANLLALIEAGIDFSDEDISFIQQEEFRNRIELILKQLDHLLVDAPRIERLAHEPIIVLAGRPNAGKSTLLNALAGVDRAIVSPEAGTTRDVLSARVKLKSGYVTIQDIAGLDDDSSTPDVIAKSMSTHAHRAIETADVVVLLVDPTDPAPSLAPLRVPNLTVFTKSDLAGGTGVPPEKTEKTGTHLVSSDQSSSKTRCVPVSVPVSTPVSISAKTGLGLDRLREEFNELAFGVSSTTSDRIAINARHATALTNAREALVRSSESIGNGDEVIAFELRAALDHLGSITGAVTPDEVLSRIFSKFCIGK